MRRIYFVCLQLVQVQGQKRETDSDEEFLSVLNRKHR